MESASFSTLTGVGGGWAAELQPAASAATAVAAMNRTSLRITVISWVLFGVAEALQAATRCQ